MIFHKSRSYITRPFFLVNHKHDRSSVGGTDQEMIDRTTQQCIAPTDNCRQKDKEVKNNTQQPYLRELDLDREERNKVQSLKSIANTIQDEILEVRKLNFISSTLQRVCSNDCSPQSSITCEDSSFSDDEEEDDLDRICREATMACLWNIIEHLFDFLEEHDGHSCCSSYREKYDENAYSSRAIRSCKNTSRRAESFSTDEGDHPQYEDWIRDLHPENVNDKGVDHRFYVLESEHRLVWNEQMENSNRADLVIHPRHSGVATAVNQ